MHGFIRYDIGEIEHQSLGLELYPSREFMSLKHGISPVPLRNMGHVETHRLHDLPGFPYCLSYYVNEPLQNGEAKKRKNTSEAENIIESSRLLIGDMEGGVIILLINDPKRPLGERKIRGRIHDISFQVLYSHSACTFIFITHKYDIT